MALRVIHKVVGGPLIGMGHVVRSLALAHVLLDLGIDIVGFAHNDDARCKDLLLSAHMQSLNVASNGVPDDIQNADVLIIDEPGPISHQIDLCRAANPQLRILALDCFEMETATPDAIVNLFNHHPSLARPINQEIEYFEGPAYAIIRPEFFAARLTSISKTIAAASHVLITFGGADPSEHTPQVLKALQTFMREGLQVDVVIGANCRHAWGTSQLARTLGATVHQAIRDLGRLMAAADIVFCGGGTTMLEAACVGAPTVVVPQTPAEARFAATFAAADAIILCDSSEHFQNALPGLVTRLIQDVSHRQQLATAGRTLVDGEGARRIAKIVTSLGRDQSAKS